MSDSLAFIVAVLIIIVLIVAVADATIDVSPTYGIVTCGEVPYEGSVYGNDAARSTFSIELEDEYETKVIVDKVKCSFKEADDE